MDEGILNDILRRLVNLETHIINLIIPLKQINSVLKSPQQILKLVEALDKPIQVNDASLKFHIKSFENSLEKFRESADKLDTVKTHSEIKYIGNRLNEIEKSLSEIKEKGLKKEVELSFTCDGYELVKKPIEYNREDPVEEPSNDLRALLNGLSKREAQSLIHRFGLFGEKCKTFEKIGDVLGVNRERSRQIVAKALRRCRHPERIELSRKIKHDELRIAICGE